jgi:hypothetical protein
MESAKQLYQLKPTSSELLTVRLGKQKAEIAHFDSEREECTSRKACGSHRAFADHNSLVFLVMVIQLFW